MIIAFTGKAGSGKNTAASMINYIVNERAFDEWQYDVNNLSKQRIGRVIWQDNSVFFEEKSFASKVKDVCSILTGVPREDWDNRELRNIELGIKGLENPIVSECANVGKFGMRIPNYTYRTFMQRVGTEAMRDSIHQDIWVNALMKDYKWALSDGWVPSYNDPDNSGNYPNAEPIYPNWVITDLRFDNEAKVIRDRGGIIIHLYREFNYDSHISEKGIPMEIGDWMVYNTGSLEDFYSNLEDTFAEPDFLKKLK